MSSSIITTIAYHTCEKRDGQNDAYLRINAPFLSVYKKDKVTHREKYQFLGDGYYFWDDDLSLAEWWGKAHYKGSYRIVSLDLVLEGERFLDAVGCKSDQCKLKDILELAKSIAQNKELQNKYKLQNVDEFSISRLLWLIQKLSATKKELFPVDAIRIMDMKKTTTKPISDVAANKKDVIVTDSMNIICVYNKKILPLQTIKIIV